MLSVYINQLAFINLQDIGYYLGAILVFGIMVMVHELGHFLVAKKMGIKVLEFSMGFGPQIISRKKGDTVYSWRAIPLGGFVHMVGEDATETDPGDPDSFQNKSFFARIATVAAGPIMNYILAFVIFFLLFFFIGDSPYTTQLGRLNPGFPAYNAGLKQGDIILSINSQNLNLEDGLKLREIIKANSGKEMAVVVNRNGEILNYKVTPTAQGYLGFEMSRGPYMTTAIESISEGSPEEKAGLKKGDIITWIKCEGDKEPKKLTYNDGMTLIHFIRESEGKKIIMGIERNRKEVSIEFTPGFVVTSHRAGNAPPYGVITTSSALAIDYKKNVDLNFYLTLIYKRQGPVQALANASKEIYIFSATLLSAIPKAIKKEIPLDLTGPLGIIVAMRDVGKYSGIYQFIRFAAVLNICIGIFNLLPIPALDGMRIVFLIAGSIRRKTVDQKIEAVIHYIGFALLLLLMVVVSYYDIQKLWSGQSIIPK